jgi:hypothetical protein
MARLEAAEAARKAEVALAAARAASVAPTPTSAGLRADWLTAAGIAPSDWGAVDFIVQHEGSWNGTQRWNTGGSGAYGLCQALPGSKMATAGADWATNPVTQLRWCDSYAHQRYGGWGRAYEFWKAHAYW